MTCRALADRLEELEATVRLQGEALKMLASNGGEVEWAEATAPPVTRIPVGDHEPPDWTARAQAQDRKNVETAPERAQQERLKANREAWVNRELERMPTRR